MHLFMYLLSFCIFSLEKCLFKLFSHLLIRLFGFVLVWFVVSFCFVFSCKSSLRILDINPLSDIWLANISSLSGYMLSYSTDSVLWCGRNLIYLLFLLLPMFLMSYPRNHWSDINVMKLCPHVAFWESHSFISS